VIVQVAVLVKGLHLGFGQHGFTSRRGVGNLELLE
jgi:hypothetical protein